MSERLTGEWIVVFRMSPYEVLAMENGDGPQANLALFESRDEAVEAVAGHILEQFAVLVNLNDAETP